MDGAIVIPAISCARAPRVWGFLPSQWNPRPREKPQPRFRQQHVSLEVATSLRATSPIWASPARTRERGAKPRGPAHPPPPRSRLPLACLSHVYFNDIPKRRACSLATILVKTFGTLCVLGEENVLQVDPPPPWTLLGVTSQTPFNLHILYTLWTSTLFRGGLGEKSCWGRVYECVSQGSCKFNAKPTENGEVSQTLLARIVETRQDKTGQCFIWSLIQSYVRRLYPNNSKS